VTDLSGSDRMALSWQRLLAIGPIGAGAALPLSK